MTQNTDQKNKLFATQKLPAGASALINSYLDGNLANTMRVQVENLIASSEEAAQIYQDKLRLRKAIKDLIPAQRPSKDSLSLMKNELREINKNLLKEKKLSLGKRIAKFLDTTIIEF